MNLAKFDLFGPEGHFRMPYTNSTRMTYVSPPRPTIVGLLAGILGRERDSYYEEMSSKNIRVGVRVNMPVRVKTVVTNMLKEQPISDPAKQQIPIQYVVNPSYTVYILADDEHRYIFDALQNNIHIYPVCLGIRSCFGCMKDIHLYNVSLEKIDSVIDLKNVINMNNIKDKKTIKYNTDIKIYNEFSPSEFVMDKHKKIGTYRRPLPFYNLVFPINGSTIQCHFNGDVVKLNNDEIINFID